MTNDHAVRLIATCLFALIAACGGARTRSDDPDQARAAVDAAPGPAPMIVVAYEGADITVNGPPDFAVLLVAADGTRFALSRHVSDWVTGQSCDNCGSGSHMPAEPPRDPSVIQAGIVAAFVGPHPTHVADARCPDGDSCLRDEPVPDGDYQIEVDGLFACPPASVHLPFTATVTVTCQKR